VDAIHDDQTGRPQVVTDASGSVVWKATNYPFERVVALDSIGGLNLGFPGQYYDAERGLWNNGFRDYNASLGRYIEYDPTGLNGGVNGYAYVRNNPLMYTDLLGLCPDQTKCSAARALLASVGAQLSSEGKALTWGGIGVVAASGVAGIFAPEAAPVEIDAAAAGASMVEFGGTVSTVGSALTGYAAAGFKGAAEEAAVSFVIGKINKLATGLGATKGVSESTLGGVSGLLDQASDGILELEAACDEN
jgi:RHS repeat-associated protein